MSYIFTYFFGSSRLVWSLLILSLPSNYFLDSAVGCHPMHALIHHDLNWLFFLLTNKSRTAGFRTCTAPKHCSWICRWIDASTLLLFEELLLGMTSNLGQRPVRSSPRPRHRPLPHRSGLDRPQVGLHDHAPPPATRPKSTPHTFTDQIESICFSPTASLQVQHACFSDCITFHRLPI